MSREILKSKPETNIILMTAFGDVETYQESLNIGIREFFNKPFDIEIFRKAVNRLMN